MCVVLIDYDSWHRSSPTFFGRESSAGALSRSPRSAASCSRRSCLNSTIDVAWLVSLISIIWSVSVAYSAAWGLVIPRLLFRLMFTLVVPLVFVHDLLFDIAIQSTTDSGERKPCWLLFDFITFTIMPRRPAAGIQKGLYGHLNSEVFFLSSSRQVVAPNICFLLVHIFYCLQYIIYFDTCFSEYFTTRTDIPATSVNISFFLSKGDQ